MALNANDTHFTYGPLDLIYVINFKYSGRCDQTTTRGEFKIIKRQLALAFVALANAWFTPSHRDHTWSFWVVSLYTQK